MRIMRYCVQLDAEEGYLICNAETSWNSMPAQATLTNPSIRIRNVPVSDTILADFADYVSPNDITLDEGEDETEDELRLSFRDNYLRILRGELSDEWVIGVVKIHRDGVTFAVFNRRTGREEDLYLYWPHYLKVAFEINREDGTTDTYILTVQETVTAVADGGFYYVSIAEPDVCGKREVFFRTQENASDTTWPYVHIKEVR